jgi:GABA(A) receptor-associated protein
MEQLTSTERLQEAERVLRKHPDRVPVLIESSTPSLVLDKHRYLVPRDLSVAQFMVVLRKRVKLAAEDALYVFVGGELPKPNTLFGSLYDSQCSEEDRLLYLTVALENTFGGAR